METPHPAASNASPVMAFVTCGDVERSEYAFRTDVTTVMRECNNVSRVFWSVLVF